MIFKKQINRIVVLFPLIFFTGLLIGLLLIRIVYSMILPVWVAWIVGIFWAIILFNYLLLAELFKQIGGFVVILLVVFILIGAMVPKEQVVHYPRKTANEMVKKFETAWDAVYSGDLFNYNLKQQLIDYGLSFGNLDPFRYGKMILFGLLGFVLATCYLFALEPSVWPKKQRAEKRDLQDSRTLHSEFRIPRNNLISYVSCFSILFLSGLIFAMQVELLQILSPTRSVTVISIVESGTGFLIGLLLFIPLHFFYLWLAEIRTKGLSRFNVLGIGIDAVNMDDCLLKFEQIVEASPSTSDVLTPGFADNQHKSADTNRLKPAMTSALGVAGIVEARRNKKLRQILNKSVLNTPDGMPLVWLGKLFGYRNIERVYGPDLLRNVCAYSASRGWKHFFYGAAPGTVEKLKAKLEKKHPDIQIVGTYCPPFRPLTLEEEADLIDQVAKARPDIFWIGISTPKQLYFMDQMRDKLDCKIICPVGYAFDVNAGEQEDAPDWAKYSGFQWLHRAIKQPRLWSRYLQDNPRFVFESILQILHLKRYPMFLHEYPLKPTLDAEGYPRFPVGVVSLSAMTFHDAQNRILNWVATGQKHYVNICVADTIVQCFDHPDLAKIINAAGMATTDGMPLVWLAHYYGFKETSRVYGPDLMLELCAATAKSVKNGALNPECISHKKAQKGDRITNNRKPAIEKKCISHFFYGTTDEVLNQLKTNLLKNFPNLQIAGMYSPPFRPLTDHEKDEVTKKINASEADIVWCGLGTPKQDYWVAEFRPRLNAAVILAVGAAFNFHAGYVSQAPRWMMKIGLEWLFRLSVEPKRLWRRYLIGNLRFISLVIGQLLREIQSKASANFNQKNDKIDG